MRSAFLQLAFFSLAVATICFCPGLALSDRRDSRFPYPNA